MKMRNHILRMVSVFFLVLMLVGCGIMTVFSIDYSFDSNTTTFTFTNPDNILSWIKQSTGPSLLLAYIVTDEPANPTILSTKFNSEFRRNIVDGRMISSGSVILNTTSNNKEYTLYKLSDSNSNEFNAPYFFSTATNPLNPDIQFSVSLTSNNTLQFTVISGSYTNPSLELTRFNGESFITVPSEVADFPDYVVSSTAVGSLYIHVYAAINISEGDFSNKYWTRLESVASIQLI
ncbi:MAG: hypothetical protein PHF06_00445 [Sphaerochaeta sp.]|uniref:hypothetical protein n=1 Tax=Sphaerochaeta sp. TaxID=1972642 RepID=UPI00258D3A89|nr:hypothetical protein [Sphaerochaeta sp.]MDD4036826.1 hypothetical protein [Sphaerochaeta sp.]